MVKSPSSKGDRPGRLYLGFCPIGISGLGVQRDVFASLLYHGQALEGDRYWSLVGYYNAVKELAAGRALVEQDVEGALNRMALEEENEPRSMALVELSGRMDSLELPILLNQLEDAKRGMLVVLMCFSQPPCLAPALTSPDSMSCSLVANPKPLLSTSKPRVAWTQTRRAAGVYLREHGLVTWTTTSVSFPTICRFTVMLSLITVRPYSMAVLERAGGPLSVAWLRNSRMATTHPWASNDAASHHVEGQPRPTEFDHFQQLIQQRNHAQPPERRIDPAPPNAIESLLDQGWEAWGQITQTAMNDDEADMQWKNHHTTQIGGNPPPTTTYVVLGDERHVKHPDQHQAAYSPSYAAPNSLRTVDSTTGVEVRRND